MNKTLRTSISILALALLGLSPGILNAADTATTTTQSARAGRAGQAAAADRWEPNIARFEAQEKETPSPKDSILFIGSSSIARWDLKKSFPDLPVVNRGFGGSQSADSVRYVERIVLPPKPKIVVFYAGDNDIAAGKKADEVAGEFKKFVAKVKPALSESRILYISIKPSLSRWAQYDEFKKTNALVKSFADAEDHVEYIEVGPAMLGADGKPKPELFVSDGLHMTDAGYVIWKDIVRPYLEKSSEKPAEKPVAK